jgi:hypothetical protein
MHESLKLTQAGDSFRQLLTKKSIKYPDARFMCYLRMLSVDLLVDPVETDRDSLIAAVSRQVTNREMHFPYVYGRELYDKLYGMPLPEHRTVLRDEETMEVLNNLPQGVFQVWKPPHWPLWPSRHNRATRHPSD